MILPRPVMPPLRLTSIVNSVAQARVCTLKVVAGAAPPPKAAVPRP